MTRQQLWSPWRLEYVRHPEKRNEGGCVFCKVQEKPLDEESLVIYRDADAFVVMNRFPYSNGHMMVIPNSHSAQLTELNAKVLAKMMLWAQVCTKVLGDEFAAQGFNVGLNLGSAAGAGIGAHLHLHVVPRWDGDTNFMPVLAEVKCIPDHLRNTYQRLAKPLQKALERVS